MSKYRLTFVAYDEENSFVCIVSADSPEEARGKGMSRLPRPMSPIPWRTWRLEAVDDSTPETTDEAIAERLREWEEAGSHYMIAKGAGE